MRRYWIESGHLEFDPAGQPHWINLLGDTYHHIIDVCRLEPGAKFEALCGDGQAYLCELVQRRRGQARARVLSSRVLAESPRPYINLVLSMPRFAVFDAVVEKSVELGVRALFPVFSQHSFVRSASKLSSGKLERWHKIIRGATQQCGRPTLMQLASPQNLSEFMGSLNLSGSQRGLFAYEGEADLSLRQGLGALPKPPALPLTELWVFVGSEGGFSLAEVEMFRAKGLEPLSLGAQILRVETACVALVSVIKYELGI